MANEVPNQMFINNVRLARVSLTQPFIGKDAPIDPATGKQKGKYHADLIIGLDHPDLEQYKGLQKAAILKKFGDKAAAVLEKIAANNKLALHRGDIDRAGKPEYAGKLYISANNDDQPTIVVTENGVNIANRGTPVLLSPSHPNYPYAGCYANVHVSVYAYDHPKGGQGVSCQLMGVQFLRHAERLQGASVSSAGEFGKVAADADGAAPTETPAGGAGLI